MRAAGPHRGARTEQFAVITPTEPNPHSVEAERALLGALILDNEQWESVSVYIGAADFSSDAHSAIYQAIGDIVRAGEECDRAAVCERLQARGALQDAGGAGYISHLLLVTPSASNALGYAGIVRDMAVLRQLARAGQEMTRLAAQGPPRKAQDLLFRAERSLFEISESNYLSEIECLSFTESFLAGIKRSLREREKQGEPVTGLTTGLTDLDQITAGWQGSDLIIVAGRGEVNKHELLLTFAQAALYGEKPVSVLFFSMKNSRRDTALKLLASLSGVNYEDLKIGRIGAQWSQVSAGLQYLADAHIFVDDSHILTPRRMRARARTVARKERLAGRRLGLVLLDDLHTVQAEGRARRHSSYSTEIGSIARALKSLARELDIPVLATSQISRPAQRNFNHTFQLSDLLASGNIEQEADIVIFLRMIAPAPEDGKNFSDYALDIAKHRNGPTGSCDISFDEDHLRYGDRIENSEDGRYYYSESDTYY